MLQFGQLIGEGDEELAIPMTLIRGEGQNTGQIIALCRGFLFGEVPVYQQGVKKGKTEEKIDEWQGQRRKEGRKGRKWPNDKPTPKPSPLVSEERPYYFLPHDVIPFIIDFTQDIEEERVDIIVQGLMIQEELGKQAQILAVDLVLLPIHLKDRQVLITINLFSRGVLQLTLETMAHQGLLLLDVFEAELTDIELLLIAVLLRERAEVPRLHLILAQFDKLDVLHLGDLLMLPLHCRMAISALSACGMTPTPFTGDIIQLPFLGWWCMMRVTTIGIGRTSLLTCSKINPIHFYPLVQSAVKVTVMHIVVIVLCHTRVRFFHRLLTTPLGLFLPFIMTRGR